MRFSHKTERGDRACDLRAHKICLILQERGVPVTDIDKAWIYSLPDENGEIRDNIRDPVLVIFPLDDELDFNEQGLYRNIDRNKPEALNIHVSPILRTQSDKELAFDTYYYDAPPTLAQLRNDFKPFVEGTELGFKRTDPSYLRFEDTQKPLPKEGSLSRVHYDVTNIFKMTVLLGNTKVRPAPEHLKAQWLEEQAPSAG